MREQQLAVITIEYGYLDCVSDVACLSSHMMIQRKAHLGQSSTGFCRSAFTPSNGINIAGCGEMQLRGVAVLAFLAWH